MAVQLNLLGRFEAFCDANRLELSSRKGEGLLAILALAPQHQCSRDELCALLWSDRGEAQARASLRQELVGLRKALGENCDVLITDGEYVGLQSAKVEIDTEQLADNDRSAATSLYRGEFMQGSTIRDPAFTDWLRDARERFARQVTDVAAGATDAAVAERDWPAATAAAERLLELDPLHETAHRALMRTYAAAGNTRQAIDQFNLCRERLRREQGADPEQTTVALLEEISAGDVVVDAAPEAVTPDNASNELFERSAVLVLPFDNLSDDSEQAYFARGITEDIITALSYWRWFPVIGPNAVGAGAADNFDALAAAASVKARYVLHGSVRRGADRVRIAVQLMDSNTGHNIWAQRFERPMCDLFQLQDEISECVVARLEPQLEKAEQSRLVMKRAEDLTAWDFILQAAQAERDGGPGYGTREANENVRALLMRALAYQPPTAQALAMLGRTHFRDSLMGWSDDRRASMLLAVDKSRESVERDPENSLGHGVLATAAMFGLGDVPCALEHGAEAVRLNPSSPLSHHCRGCSLEFAGLAEQAVPHLETVFRLDPNYSAAAAARADLALCYMILERYADAEQAARRVKSLAPDYVRGQHRYVAALAYAGRKEEAEAALAELFTLQPDFSLEYIDTTYPFARDHDRQVLIEGLRKAGWKP